MGDIFPLVHPWRGPSSRRCLGVKETEHIGVGHQRLSRPEQRAADFKYVADAVLARSCKKGFTTPIDEGFRDAARLGSDRAGAEFS